MIELRADGSIPGPDQYGRIYKVVDPMTGIVAYNMRASDLPEGEPDSIKRIRAYDSFAGFVTDILPIEEANRKVRELNDGPKEKVSTSHTRMIQRVRRRLAEGIEGDIDGFTALQDMAEMLADIEGRRQRPALPGWGR